MHFALGVVATLAVAAEALPKGPGFHPLDSRNSDNVTILPQPGVLDTCKSIESKTLKSWSENAMGDWFVERAKQQGEFTQDIQKTLQSWAEGADIYGFHCDPMEDCSPSFPVEECEEEIINAAVYFVLWCTSYFNKWVTSLVRAVDITSGIATGKAPKIAETFSTDPKSIPLNTAGGVLAAGFLGSIGSLFPGAFGTGAAIGSTLATVAVGAMSQINYGKDVELEPTFDTFEDVSDYIAGSTENMISGLEAFAKKVLVEIPESSNNESYADDPQGLPQILYDGSFTSSVSVSVLDKGIYTSLFGGAITTAWRNEGASIVKVYADEFTLTTPPCETEGFFPNRVWCDDEGTAYVLLKFPKKNTWYDNPMSRDVIEDFMDVPGVDDLDDYAISIQTVARGSDLAFNINDGKPYYQWDAQTTLDHLKNHTEESATFSTFNLPICDLRTDGNFYGMEPKAIDDDDCGAECQILYRMSFCAAPWDMPDEYGEIFWKDEHDFKPSKNEYCSIPGGIAGSCGSR